MSITEELVAKGHSSSGFCQKCWDEAYWRSVFIDPDKAQVDHYYEVMAEAVSGKDVADSQPEPDAANPEGFVRPAVTEAQPWRVWYDNYEKGSAYIGPDVDTIIADDLYYEKAEAICEAHNAALAAVPAPSPAPAAEPSIFNGFADDDWVEAQLREVKERIAERVGHDSIVVEAHADHYYSDRTADHRRWSSVERKP